MNDGITREDWVSEGMTRQEWERSKLVRAHREYLARIEPWVRLKVTAAQMAIPTITIIAGLADVRWPAYVLETFEQCDRAIEAECERTKQQLLAQQRGLG